MNKIKAFEVVTNTDLTEGRGSDRVIAYVLDHELARAWASDKGVMGSPAQVRAVDLYEVEGTYFPTHAAVKLLSPEDLQAAQAEIRRKALRKLTAAEIAALGLELVSPEQAIEAARAILAAVEKGDPA